jgi:ATP-binding cassette subfamily B protein
MHIFLRTAALFWRYWPRAVAAYFCLLAGAGLALAIPRLTGQAIDQALSSSQVSALVLTALGVAGAGLLRSGFSYWQSYLSEFLSQKVAYDLRHKLYDRLQRLSYAFHDQSQTGQLISRATNDVEAVRMFTGFAMLRGVYFLVLMIAIVVLMLTLDWKLALISLSVVPFISYRAIAINQKLRVLWMKIQQGIGVLGTMLQENITGARIVQAFAREEHESQKFSRQAETIYNQEIEVNNLLAANSPVMSFALLLAMAAILWYGGRQVITGALTQGELVQFLLYLVMLNMPVRMLGWMTTLFSRAMASGRRIYEIVDQVSPVRDSPGARNMDRVEGRVAFENVSFSYDSHGDVLKDIDFEARPGQVIALVGASGSGKSTIANLIPRFYDVTSGRITIDGIDIRDLALASLRRHIGIVHQDTFLFSATIRENISYGRPEASLEEIAAAARAARLHDFIMGLPEGYNTLVGERGITLSGGQKQRLAIARTLLLNPRILIMDDSTSSVDNETEYLIQQALTEALLGRTTFIIAHRLRSVQRADLILVLKDGRIVEHGRHEALLAAGGLYQQLYGLQFQPPESAGLPAAMPLLAREPEAYLPAEGTVHRGTSDRRLSDSLSGTDDIVFGKPYDSRVVSRLVGYFKAHRTAVILTIAATLLFTFSSVANPYIVGLAENNYIVTGNLSGLNMIVLVLIGMGLLNWVAYYGQIRAEARLGQGILLKLRCQLFKHIQHLSVRFFSHNEVGRIMSRVQNDVGDLGEFLDSGAFWVIGEVVSMAAIVVVMFTMGFNLALITLSVMPLLIIFIIFWQGHARQSFIKVRQAISLVNGALEENISGVRVIQSLLREDLNLQQFDRVNQANFEANLRSVRISAAMMPAMELLMSLATAAIVMFGGLGVLAGTMLVGTLVAFVLYIQNFFDPIRNLTMEYTQLQIAMASGARIFELLDMKPEVKDSPESTPAPRLNGEVRLEDVSFSYEPGIEVIHGINLYIPAGNTVALVGPTGAGKSTIVSLIARFYDVTEGRILIDGHDLRQMEITSYRRHLGLVLQDPFLFSGTIRDNIRYGNLEAADEEVIAAARAVGADDFIRRLEKGYETQLQEQGQNLSMGQRQLISFARALIANPAILLLDEATASIDSYSESIIQQGLRHLKKGRTTIVIAHRLSTVRDADRIVVLDKGQVVEEGKHEELVARGGLYTRLYEMTYAPVARAKGHEEIAPLSGV